MALQAALPPTDSQEMRRTALLRRLARTRAQASPSAPRRARSTLWDPARFLGFSPQVTMILSGALGAALGAVVFSTYQVVSRAAPQPVAEPVALEAGATSPAPGLFVTVPELSEPAQLVDDYYFYLRQGMLDSAWALTDDEFRNANYPAGFEGYSETWSSAQAMEVLSLELLWQDAGEARLAGEIQEGGTDHRYRYTYVLRWDEATSTWKLHSITPAW